MLIRNSIRSTRGRQRGVTLIEVLVTVAVTSVGLLGMAGLTIVSQRVNHEAYLRTQANFLAQSLIDSMHINVPAVVGGDYNGSYAGDMASETACATQGCTPQQRARYDMGRFDRFLANELPGGKASVSCANGTQQGAGVSAAYNGLCRLEIGWSGRRPESGAERGSESSVWIFQP